MYRQQQNITLTESQVKIVTDNFLKVNIRTLSNMAGVTYNKMYNNLRLMGYVNRTDDSVTEPDGNFNLDQFAKYYKS